MVLGLGLAAVYLLVPGTAGQELLFAAAGTGSVLCVVAGIRAHRPDDPVGWYLLALGMAANVCGDLLARLEGVPPHGASPHLSAATLTYVAGYVCLFAAATRIGRDPGRTWRREDEADAAIITLGVLALSWYFLMASYAGDNSLTSEGRLALLSYPVLDIVLVFLVLRSLVFGGSERPFRPILAAGLLLIAVAGFAEGLAVLHGHRSGEPFVAGFLVAYVLIGAAALHPSMAEISTVEPRPVPNVYRREPNGIGRIPAVAFAGFVPPSILLIASCLDASVGIPGDVRALPGRIRSHLPADDVAHRADHRADQRDRGSCRGPWRLPTASATPSRPTCATSPSTTSSPGWPTGCCSMTGWSTPWPRHPDPAARSRCASVTSTGSRRSTTRSATTSATASWSAPAGCSRRSSDPETRWPGSAATSSPSSWWTSSVPMWPSTSPTGSSACYETPRISKATPSPSPSASAWPMARSARPPSSCSGKPTRPCTRRSNVGRTASPSSSPRCAPAWSSGST